MSVFSVQLPESSDCFNGKKLFHITTHLLTFVTQTSVHLTSVFVCFNVATEHHGNSFQKYVPSFLGEDVMSEIVSSSKNLLRPPWLKLHKVTLMV